MMFISHQYFKSVFSSMILWALLQGIYTYAKYSRFQHDTELSIVNLEKRVSLDLVKIRLANDKYNTVAHYASVKDYISRLNDKLSHMDMSVRLIQLQDVEVSLEEPYEVRLSSLNTADQAVELKIANKPLSYVSTISPLPLLLALIWLFISKSLFIKPKSDEVNAQEDKDNAVKLIINLQNKTLLNPNLGAEASLPNKPFCFYAALIDYCISEPDPYLSQNKEVPEDILVLANKYFYRLIELGHTKRKRPDFSTNLDKTLSEIRAALDSVFINQPDLKELFYPPRAQGEGSRSKLHNYALAHIDSSQLEFIGK